jgi:hypothetical protein
LSLALSFFVTGCSLALFLDLRSSVVS